MIKLKCKGEELMKISTEYRRGILFIRPLGRIDDNEFLNKINEIIDWFGIKYIVLNISNLDYISLSSIKHITNYNNEILKKKKHLLICDSRLRMRRLFNIIPNISNELEAFSLI